MPRATGPLLAALLVAGSFVFPLAGPAAAKENATVTVVHALPPFTYDVYVNGQLTLDGFKPELVTDPLELPAGDYDLALRDVGAPATSDPVVQATATLEAGTNYSIVAHYTPDGGRAISVFKNDLNPVPAGKSRLVVRNVADAEAVDIDLDGHPKVSDLANSEEAASNVSPGSHSIEALDAGGSDPLVNATEVVLHEGAAGLVYVEGSASYGELNFMVESLSGLASDPGGVTSGSGGLADSHGMPGWAVVLMGLAGFIAAASVLSLRRSRWTEK